MAIDSSGFTSQVANAVVVDAYTVSGARADDLLTKVYDALADLNTIQVSPITFSVDYHLENFLPTFVRPARPDEPVFPVINPQELDTPSLADVSMRDIGEAPAEPDFSTFYNYAPPLPPSDPAPVAPTGITPVLDPFESPDRPVYDIPSVPTLYSLNLPVPPTVTIPPIDFSRPVFQYDVPDNGALEYVEHVYTSQMLDDMRATISNMMQGNYGLPLAVEQALFDRGRVREDRLSRKQVMEVTEDMASRNLVEPNGVLAARLREVRADNREKVAALNRDLTIERAKEALEGVKFAVAQGMALEQTLIQQNEAYNERTLKIAIYARDFAINRLNAQISVCNLQTQLYATDAQVWRQRLEGELAKLEIYKAEIDAQRLIGEINTNLIEQYKAQFAAVQAMADIYRTDVEAAKAKNEINMQRIEAAKLTLESYSTQVEGWAKLWDGYKSQVDAALGVVNYGEVLATIYSTRVQSYKTKGDAYAQEAQTQIAANGQTLDLFRTELANAEQNLRGQIAQLDAVSKQFDGRVGLYQADSAMAQAESAALDRATELKIDQEKARTDVALRQADINIQQMLKIGEILVEQLRDRAQALSQLLASSMSSVNVSAGISGSGSTSDSVSWGYSGEAADWETGPPFV